MSNPPELFVSGRGSGSGSGRPVRSEFSRRSGAPSYAARRCITLSLLVLLMGFGVYKIWRGPQAPGAIPTIRSEGAYKEKPEQPGGIDIPHQDVQVYSQIDGTASADAKPGVEHMLPPPEEPAPNAGHIMSLSPAFAATEVPVEDLTAVTATPALSTFAAAEPAAEPPPVATPAPPASAPVAVAPAPVVDDPIVALNAPTAPVVTTVMPQTPKRQPAAAPVAPPPETKTASGNTVIQLASVPDATGATTMAKKLQAKYASTLGEAHLRPVRAEIPGKGTFYRIRSQPLSASRAQSVCKALKASGTECILVHP